MQIKISDIEKNYLVQRREKIFEDVSKTLKLTKNEDMVTVASDMLRGYLECMIDFGVMTREESNEICNRYILEMFKK